MNSSRLLYCCVYMVCVWVVCVWVVCVGHWVVCVCGGGGGPQTFQFSRFDRSLGQAFPGSSF